MTEAADIQGAEDRAFDEYVAAARSGVIEDVQAFCRRHGDTSEGLRRRIEALCWMIAGHRHTPASDERPPFEHLGEYRLVRRLGEGGMGVVFLAIQESLQREVALKVIRPERSGSKQAERRFDREVSAVAKLQHPNIVTVFGTGEEQGVRYLAMEYLRGDGLDQLLKAAGHGGRTLSLQRVLRFGRQIALALEAAHSHSIVHRDVKPSNIWITEQDDCAKLMDFGLARDLREGDSSLTQGFTGSPHYAAPEQIDATAGAISAATDIYALGVTLYELVAGQVPFEGASTEQLFRQVLLHDPIPLRRRNKDIPRDVETVISRAMEKAPRRRYASAGALARDLGALLELKPVSARPVGRLTLSLRLVRRHGGASTLVGALLLMLLVGAAVLFAGRHRQDAAYAGELSAAALFVEAGEFERAFSALDRALAHRPGDSVALLRRRELELREHQARIDRALARARTALAAYRSSRQRLQSLDAELRPRLLAARGRYVEPQATRALMSAQRELDALQREADEQFFAGLEVGRAALLLADDNRVARELMADLYLEKWRGLIAADKREQALFYQDQVEQNDPDGRHTVELRGLGLVTIRSTPAAEAFLFQYLPQSGLLPDGDERLVPVPLGGPPDPVAPGTHALRVVRSAPPLETNDLVLEIEGHPVESLVLVTTGQGEVQRFDRLLALDGEPVYGDGEVAEVEYRERATRGGREVELELSRDSRRFTVRANSWSELGITAMSAERVLRALEVHALVYQHGVLEELLLPAGIETRLTATPLLLSPACRIGSTPLLELSLPPGSYLLLLRAEGFADQRYPFVLERRGRAELDVKLLPLEDQLDEFVYIPPGILRTGGDARAQSAFDDQRLPVDGFWIMDRPVKSSEYLEFLNDPRTQEWIRSSPEAVGFPRISANLQSGGFWSRQLDGRYRLEPREVDWPVYGVSLVDARAFVKYKNARAEDQGRDERYSLPTEPEWERAARGADRRAFAFGDRFVPVWVDSLYGQKSPNPEPVRSHPIDESPFGVFDMTGAVSEWCRAPPEENMYPMRSTSWANAIEEYHHLATRTHAASDHTSPGTGLRLVIHR